MADRSESDADEKADTQVDAPLKATEMGPIFWISIGLGTVASLPMFSGMANGTVTIARGAMWFLITTLVAMIGVWTIAWLMHVFTDPYPGELDDDVEDDAETSRLTADTEDASPVAEPAPEPAMSEVP